MGQADHLVLGDYNAACFECGGKRKASQLQKHWKGYYVCKDCWEPRHPQDFVGVVPKEDTPAWTQPENEVFIAPFPEPTPYDPTES